MVYLYRLYKGYPPGYITQFSTQEEAALVAQGFAMYSNGPVSPLYAITPNSCGRVGVYSGSQSNAVLSPNITPESKFLAYISSTPIDSAATYVASIVPDAGSVTFILNSVVVDVTEVMIDWVLLNISGDLPLN